MQRRRKSTRERGRMGFDGKSTESDGVEGENEGKHMVHGHRCKRIFHEFLPLEIEVEVDTP